MTSKKLLLAGLIAAMGLASSVQAAVISVRPTNVTIHNPGSFTGTIDPSLVLSRTPESIELAARPEAYVLKIDVLINISDLAAGELGFGNVDFDITMDGVTRNVTRPNWRLDSTQLTVDEELASKWSDNSDLGNATDLKHIVMGVAPKNFGADDPRRTLGTAPYDNPPGTNYDGEYAGAIYVDLAGLAGTSGSVTISPIGGSTYDANMDLISGATLEGATINFQVVPEPSTLALLGLGGALLVLARKRR